MKSEQRAELFAATADRLDIQASLIEKDFWVCWVLKQIFSIESFSDRLLFKGGTSLSKVFGAINRFSEDIDLAVDYAMLGFTGLREPTQPGLSKTKRADLLAEMLQQCQRYIRNDFQPALADRFTGILGSKMAWSLMIDEQDSHIVRFQYPTAVQQRVAYVAPQVVLELGTHAEFVPRGEFAIRAFAATEFPGFFEEPEIRVVSLLAKRTFWEKATILHAEYHRAPEKPLPARYARHYYDLAMLARAPLQEDAVSDIELLAQVVRHKQAFYPSAWAQYALAVPGSFRLVPPAARIAALKADYGNMSVMLFGKPPSFESILTTLMDLEQKINALGQH